MRQFFFVILTAVSMVFSPSFVSAQDFGTLLRDFDSRALSHSEKRFIQAALAFEGDYSGLLDGDWGRLSQRALQRYSRREFGTAYEEWHLTFLAISFLDLFETDGWRIRYFPDLHMSALWPEKTITRDAPTDSFLNYRHTGSSLSISIGRHSQSQTQNIHNFTLGTHERSSEPYTVRKNNFAVSSATARDGAVLYARSNFIDGAWSTIMLSAERRDKALLNAVTASISVGRAPDLAIQEGGRLEEAILKTIALIEQEQDEGSVPKATTDGSTNASPSPEPSGGSGSGFFVSNEGHVLTNAHVVQNCSSIFVDGKNAALVSESEQFDLAILRTSMAEDKAVAVFSTGPARLNSDVTVVGYPFAGLLGGLNVTRGSVSSLKGLGGDAVTMQVTAPIQMGNSGGPLIGADGEVIGVVVSKLDALKAVEVFGDIPQNVNFAVRGEIAKLFLAQNGINPILGYSDDKVDPVNLANSAASFTVFIECK